MILAVLKFVFLKNFLNLKGRASRPEFWYAFLFNVIVTLILSFIPGKVGMVLQIVYWLAVFLPFLGVSVRRLHDINKSGWLILLGLIQVIGEIILIIWWAKQGDATENQYGPVPEIPSVEG